GALDGGLEASNTHGLNCRGNFQTVFRIVITDEEWRSRFIGKRFPQLLHNPGARRMARDVEVQDAPAIMANNEEAIEETEGDRRNGEEIHGRHGFAMIAEKCRPPPSRFWVPGGPLHPAGDASLRDMEAQHQKFAMNAGSPPGGVLSYHAEDQVPDFLGNPLPTNPASHLRDQGPIQTEAGSMPTNHGLRGNDDQLLPERQILQKQASA